MLGTKPDPHEPWPFVARTAELAALVAAITVPPTESNRQRHVLVGGPAGVGKTRLVRAALDTVSPAELAVEWIVGTRAESSAPYAALAHVAPEVTAAVHGDALSLFAAVARELTGRAGGRRVVVGVDDAHLLHEASAAIVLHLALSGVATVVATVRTGEALPEPIAALGREGTGRWINLSPLDDASIRELLTAVLGGEVSDRAIRRLVHTSEGNVLFLRELVLGALETGGLRHADGAWRWDGNLPQTQRLVDAIDRRLGALSPAGREALALLAVAEPLALEIAEQLMAPSVLTRLESLRLLEVEPAGSGRPACRLTHPLHGEALLAQLGVFEHRQLMRRLADAFAGQAVSSPEDRIRAATWRWDGGGHISADELTAAAELANQRFDPVGAERLGRAALDHGGGAPARVELARSLLLQNSFVQAEQVLAEAEADVLASDDPCLQEQYLDRRFTALAYGLGRADDAGAVLDHFSDSVPGRAAAHTVAGLRAHLLEEAGRPGDALACARPALEDLDAPPLARFLALATTIEALSLLGLTAQAVGASDQLRELASSAGPDGARAGQFVEMADVFRRFLDGQVGDLLSMLEAAHRHLHTSADDAKRSLVALSLGSLLLAGGAPVSARRRLLDAVAILRRTDIGRMLPWALALLARSEAVVGATALARESLAEAEGLRTQAGSARQAMDFALARSMVDAASGRLEQARHHALEAAGRLPELRVHRAVLLHLAVRLGADPAKVLEPLAEVASEVESPLPAMLSAHVRAWSERDAGALVAVADRFEERGMTLLAAEALVHAVRSADQISQVRVDRSEIERRARSLAVRCEGAVTPLLADLGSGHDVSGPADELLTGRELAVLRLVVAGWANASIASDLNVSVRTVERHLSNVFAKTGTVNRTAAAAWCLRHGVN